MALFQFYQLFNYQFIQIFVRIYLCVYIWSFYIKDTRTGTFTLIQCSFFFFLYLEILLSLFISITILFNIISIIIIIELTHSKTILEITVEIETQPAALDFKNLSQYSGRSK